MLHDGLTMCLWSLTLSSMRDGAKPQRLRWCGSRLRSARVLGRNRSLVIRMGNLSPSLRLFCLPLLLLLLLLLLLSSSSSSSSSFSSSSASEASIRVRRGHVDETVAGHLSVRMMVGHAGRSRRFRSGRMRHPTGKDVKFDDYVAPSHWF